MRSLKRAPVRFLISHASCNRVSLVQCSDLEVYQTVSAFLVLAVPDSILVKCTYLELYQTAAVLVVGVPPLWPYLVAIGLLSTANLEGLVN